MRHLSNLSVCLSQKLPWRVLCCLETTLNKVRESKEVRTDTAASTIRPQSLLQLLYLQGTSLVSKCSLLHSLCSAVVAYSLQFNYVLYFGLNTVNTLQGHISCALVIIW